MENHRTPIVFDLGGVLIDWDPRYLYRKLLNGDAGKVEEFLAATGFFEWNLNQDRGYPFAQAVEEQCARHPEHAHLIRAYDQRYEESILGPIQPTVSLLGALKQAGYPLYALSNWSYEKFRQVRYKFEFFDWFEDMVISGEVALIKPDPRIYRLLLDRIGRPAGECVFVDDVARNLQPARELGVRTILFEDAEQLRAALSDLGVQV